MRLTDFFTTDKHMSESHTSQVRNPGNISAINRQIHSLVPGQTLQGELVGRNGSEVQIKLAEDLVIKARVDQNINLELGKMVTFEIKNNGHSLVLSPLFTNVATDANILKALDMASLPVNENTVSMTEQLMGAGLSIDRNSLQQLFRECNTFSEAPVADIIALHKMTMTVNEGNLEQLAAYKNLTHQLVKGLTNCVEELPNVMQSMLQSGEVEGAVQLYQEVLGILEEMAGEDVIFLANDLEQTAEKVVITDNAVSEEGMQTAPIQQREVPKASDILLKMLQELQEKPTQDELFTGGLSNQLQEEAQSTTGDMVQKELLTSQSHLTEGLTEGALVNLSGSSMENGQALLREMLTLLGQHPQAEQYQNLMEQLQQINLKELNAGEAAQMIESFLNQGIQNGDKVFVKGLMENQELQKLLKDSLQRQWTIAPEEVADEKRVEELYQRLNRQLRGLAQTLEQVGQTQSEAYRATTNLAQNLDFLQQLNQTYAYVQLPLRLQQGNHAHGELFVYTNKKHMAAQDGKISALLHLDMEHLGPIDIYVAMQNTNVTTKFYVKDDEMLDFLMEHMDVLTERLQKRGYNCGCELVLRESAEEQKGIIGEILTREQQVPIAQYAFDVRT